jgi:hypothetical protein
MLASTAIMHTSAALVLPDRILPCVFAQELLSSASSCSEAVTMAVLIPSYYYCYSTLLLLLLKMHTDGVCSIESMGS